MGLSAKNFSLNYSLLNLIKAATVQLKLETLFNCFKNQRCYCLN